MNETRRASRLPLALRAALLLAALAPLLAPPARAQRITLQSPAYEDAHFGYRLKVPAGWDAIPVTPEKAELGLLLHLDADEEGRLLYVFRLTPDQAPEDEGDEPATRVQKDVGRVLASRYFGLPVVERAALVEDETLEWQGRPVRHRTWELENSGPWVDAWSFHREDGDFSLIYTVDSYVKQKKTWMRLYEQSARTFEAIEREGAGSLARGASYDGVFAWHAADAERTPGWRALRTPSEAFVVKTSSDDDRFIDEVVDRLERAREIFEQDFPPEDELTAISVVRVCGSAEEFHRYGGTSAGVAGWFNPSSTELVLYDAQAVDRNMTYAVMIHEGFHQYCHFLFGQSEAHRWFDEGHGDYYGGMSFKYRRPRITARMPAGLNRLQGAKSQVATGSFTPLREHLYHDHRSWQRGGLDSYEQSWSIVYMLRQGMEGEVTRKVWDEAYAEIIPNYVRTLRAGFELAYEELRYEATLEARAQDREPTPEEFEFTRADLDEERKLQIWDEAMKASWGQIDLDTFEEHWQTYVDRYLKD